jgi:large subunit ribosomal protein L24
MKIKKGDKVKMRAGKDKGKTGKVVQIFPARNRASVEGLNILIKHLRPRRSGEQGQRVEFPGLVDLSNLGLVCPHCGKTTRVASKTIEKKIGEKTKQHKLRVCQKCQEVID